MTIYPYYVNSNAIGESRPRPGTQFAAVVYDDGVNSANSVVPLIRNEYSHYVKYDAICDPELHVL